ncbi:MAG TPA: glycosyltransferase [Desulfosporosinus sp.]|nr:glycosyltransferase [Desulfosporosinus sp.]
MKTLPLVSCLTATYGRYTVLTEAISCFLAQDYPNKELIILNNHPAKLICDLPEVIIYNEPGYPTLGDCRNRLLDLAEGEFVRTWDDDDLYLPWAISQGILMIPDNAPAWKPLRSWGWQVKEDRIYLGGNKYEASWTTRIEIAKKYGYISNSGGNEHNKLEEGIRKEGGIPRMDVGASGASYVYRWGSGLCRISGSLDKTKNNIAERTERWKKQNDDHGDGKPIKPVSLIKYWERIERARYELDAHTNETGKTV